MGTPQGRLSRVVCAVTTFFEAGRSLKNCLRQTNFRQAVCPGEAGGRPKTWQGVIARFGDDKKTVPLFASRRLLVRKRPVIGFDRNGLS